MLVMKGTLQDHLIEVDTIAQNRVDYLMNEMAKSQNVDENLKAIDQLKWVRNDE